MASLEFLSAGNLEEALDFAERSYVDSAWKDYPFDRELLKKNLQEMIDKSYSFTCLCRQDGKLVGYWFASLCRLLCSMKLRGEENGVYILPEHRSGRAALLMYKEYIKWCKKHDAEPMASVQFGDEEANQKAYAFFKRLGMIECGRIFRGWGHELFHRS